MGNCLDNVEPIPVVCRQSTLACALACPRKWWYKYRMGITFRGGEVKRAATLGTLYHRLQCLGPRSEQAVKAEVQKEQTALMDRVNRGEDLDGNMARQAGMLTELYHKAVVMATIFWERYPPSPALETIGREVSIHISPDGSWMRERWGFPLEGTVDLILKDKDGSVWIRDFKSTGQSLETIFGGLAWSLQARIYRVLVNSYDGLPVKGFILDGIMTPGIKLCRTDEKYATEQNIPVEDAYLIRVKNWYKEKPEDTVRSRGIIYTEPLWPEELLDAMRVFHYLTKDDPRKPEQYVRDTTRRECYAYGKQCIYHDLCNLSSRNWDSLFETKFRFIERGKNESGHEEEVASDSVPESDEK